MSNLSYRFPQIHFASSPLADQQFFDNISCIHLIYAMPNSVSLLSL